MKVLVCDDIKRRGERVKKAIENTAEHETELLSGTSLEREIEKLFKRSRFALDSKILPRVMEDETSPFTSNFDIAILDNNLSALDIGGARQTAESIAGYLRAFGHIPYIVSLNKNPHVDFDLRYLVGDHETYADLAVNDDHLSNRALWTGKPGDAPDDGFLPWYWPPLNDVATRRRRQIQFVDDHLDKPILRSMGFPTSEPGRLSRHAKGALSPEATRETSVTFIKFFETACRSLPVRDDRRKLAVAAQEGGLARDIVTRVAAGELDRWFRRDLLGPQDILVDLPHLLMRMPFLLGSDAVQSIERWNDALTTRESPYGLSREIYEMHLQNHPEFVRDIWTQTPCFWWKILKSNTELNDMFFKTGVPWAEAVFCEDLSRFSSRNDGVGPTPIEFAAEFEGSWSRRYVAHRKSRQYAPKSRLAK